ncbi:hypothetical protein AB5I41_13675 [Sphingomonas sp. MMS24-JH45]
MSRIAAAAGCAGTPWAAVCGGACGVVTACGAAGEVIGSAGVAGVPGWTARRVPP